MHSIEQATKTRDALASVLPISDARLAVLDTALASNDAKLIDAAVDFAERSTPPEHTALIAVKRNLVEDAHRFAPTLGLVVDVGAIGSEELGASTHFQILQSQSLVKAGAAYLLHPTSMPDGRALGARIVFPGGARTADTRLVDAAMRIVLGGLQHHISTESHARSALLSAAVTPSKK